MHVMLLLSISKIIGVTLNSKKIMFLWSPSDSVVITVLIGWSVPFMLKASIIDGATFRPF